MNFISRLLDSKYIVLILFLLALVVARVFSLPVIGTSDTKSNTESVHNKLNISCFIYRDVNLNGKYDMVDRPYAGLRIEMRRPSADKISTSSNIAGFANFKMSLNNNNFAIYSPGKHHIQAFPAKDWVITSNNASQTLDFAELDGSPAGIILKNTCEPIGVAPTLKISGRVALDDFGPDNSINSFTAVSPDGERINIDINDSGLYSFTASEGEWELVLVSNSNALSRVVTITNTAVFLSQFKPTESSTSELKPGSYQVDFDDLTSSDTLIEVPNGYGQLNWKNWIATHHKFYKGYGYINATVSPEYHAYNSSGHPAVIWSEQAFDFDGVYISVAWPKAENSDTIIRAWRGDNLVHVDRLRLNTKGAIYFDADYRNITKLVFSTEKYWQLVIDGFKYRMDH